MKSVLMMIIAIVVTGGVPAWANQTASPPTRDVELEAKILANLLADRDLKNNRIDVNVEGDSVTLKGKVDSESERAKAARLAQVDGIAIVHDELEIGSKGVKEAVTDTAITTKLRAQLLADETLRRATISVSTNNGVVTLEGVVPSRPARAKAIGLATHSKGVTRVEDRLHVEGQ
jgi:hyperosmotically inducible protein